MRESRQTHPAGGYGFGSFSGVYVPSVLTILGVVLFLRMNYVTGMVGAAVMVVLLGIALGIALLTVLSTSAVVTNMEMRGGGAYFLISRVLGPEFGGAIGLTLFLAQSVSVAFHILGFAESVALDFPALRPWFAEITLASGVAVFLITWLGADWSIRSQYFILAVLAGSILLFLGGALAHFSPATLLNNLPPSPTVTGGASFWTCFAILFPAVTGFLVGLNMSGDLADPKRSIPRGMLFAVGTVALIYLFTVLLFAGAFPRERLIEEPYLIIREVLPSGLRWTVSAGIITASISSALGAHLSAPRVLQAVARDDLLPLVRFFARGSTRDEPRRATLLTGTIMMSILCWAAFARMGQSLNQVAGILTLFFLSTYFLLNFAAFVESYARNPSFRPRFRFFHWGTALAGCTLCAGAGVLINPWGTVIVVVTLSLLYRYLRGRGLQTVYGDARRGLYYRNLRANLLALAAGQDAPRNWRPVCLVFTGYPESRLHLVSYGCWFEAGAGLVYLVRVLEGDPDHRLERRAEAEAQLKKFCRERGIQAFPIVIAAENLESGIRAVLQIMASSPAAPNLALFGWSTRRPGMGSLRPEILRFARSLDMGILLLKPGSSEIRPESPKRIDIWWRGLKNGGLMMLLAHLLTWNWEWKQSRIRILRVVADAADQPEALAELQELIHRSRMNVEPVIIASDEAIATVVHRESGDASLVMLGFELPEPSAFPHWAERLAALMPPRPVVVLVHGTGKEDIFS